MVQSRRRNQSAGASMALVALICCVLSFGTTQAQPTPAPAPFCYDNSTILVNDIAKGTGIFPVTYILCPNTVFNIGTPNFRLGTVEGGDTPIAMKSKNTIQCGADGNPANNCILRGGSNQLVFGPGGSFFLWRLTDVVVKGLTFEAPRITSFSAAAEGDITLEDCVFRNIKSSAPFLLLFEPFPPFSPEGTDTTLYVTIRRTVFEYIEQTSGLGGLETDGIVTSITPYNQLVMENCTFRHNRFAGFDRNPNGYAIKMNAGAFTIKNSCFYNNTFTGWAPLQIFNTTILGQEQNYVGNAPLPLTCPLLAASDLAVPDLRSHVTCSPPTQDKCLLDGTQEEIIERMEPTAAPVVSESSAVMTTRSLFSLLTLVPAVFVLLA